MTAPKLQAPSIKSWQQTVLEADPDYWAELRLPIQYEFSDGREFDKSPSSTQPVQASPALAKLKPPTLKSWQQSVIEADPNYWIDLREPLQYEFTGGDFYKPLSTTQLTPVSLAPTKLRPPSILSWQQHVLETDPYYWAELRQPVQYEFNGGNEFYRSLSTTQAAPSAVPLATLKKPSIRSWQQLIVEADPDYWIELRQPLQYEFSDGSDFYKSQSTVQPSAPVATAPRLQAPRITNWQQSVSESDPDYWIDLRQPVQYEFSNGREFYLPTSTLQWRGRLWLWIAQEVEL